MYTIIDRQTGNEIRTHNMFRVGTPFPNLELGENEQVVFITESLLETLKSAYECNITVDKEGTATAITVTKTLAEWQAENPPAPAPPTAEERITALEEALLDLL